MAWRKWEGEKRNRLEEQKQRWHYFFLAWAILLYMIDLFPSRRLFYALIIPLLLYFAQMAIIVYSWWKSPKNRSVEHRIAKLGSLFLSFLFVLGFTVGIHHSRYEEIIVNQFGVSTTATIVDIYVTHGRRHSIPHVTLQYVGEDRTYQTTRTISNTLFYRLERGDPMAIRYWPDNPQYTAWNDVSQSRVNLGAIVTSQFILLALMGLGTRQMRQTQKALDS
jgi:hypothetical protein